MRVSLIMPKSSLSACTKNHFPKLREMVKTGPYMKVISMRPWK